jgi:hypothetical protein
MSVSDLVIATGTATLANGTRTYVNPKIPAGAVALVTVSVSLPIGPTTRVGVVADNTAAGQITFNAITAAGAVLATDVSTISFTILKPNFLCFESS